MIFCGGFNNTQNIKDLISNYSVQGVAIADYLHYKRGNISEIKEQLKKDSINIR
jgi:imidazole glycerol phosphate synthase subunit HisF